MLAVQCPKCRGRFAPVSTEHQDVLRCSGCSGVWLSRTQLLELIRGATATAGITKKTIGFTETAPEPSQLICPACSTSLERMRFRAVEVECCPRCNGVFLDRGELEAIATRVIKAENLWHDEQVSWDVLYQKLKLEAAEQQVPKAPWTKPLRRLH